MRILILGAGPAGLSLACRLKQKGFDDFLVLEKENCAGGLCRSVNVDGSPFDIGGGHFLDVRRPSVNEFLFRFMPEEEWNIFERDSRISVNGITVSHPIEANIWQMPDSMQEDYLDSISKAGCNIGQEMPSSFVDWIYWKLGSKIADDYMIPYNKKMFGENLNQLGTYWLEKLPNVSYEETKKSCEQHKAFGKQPCHAQFYYPKKHGYGELWLRMAESIKDNIRYNASVDSIDFNSKTVITTDGEAFQSEYIITTIPWIEFKNIIGMPVQIKESISQLKYSSIQTEYFPENLDMPCHWIYYPDPKLSYHRILLRHNFSIGSKGYWTETNSERINHSTNNYSYLNKYAYPLNTINKPTIMKELLDWSKAKGVYGLGRWGEHKHYNSDAVVELALKLADSITE
ncbi:MAG: FAD-dependent oxidoreductase [Clostridia bacterium]|nr:FAD-dependent oxidoreductase [Clostridia bacterium]